MKKKILVIDDEEFIRKLMKRLLLQAGYVVSLASDGEEALGILKQSSIDLIILDMNMPRMSGLDFLRILRKERKIEIPVLMLSGSTDTEQRVQSYQLGAYDYIKKPEQTEVMLKRVENGLKIGEMINFNEFMRVELLMARKLQKYLYPETNMVEGRVAYDVWFQPLSDIGGDLYDFVHFRDGRSVFFVADVSGHSISAAMFTAIVKMVFRNAIKTHDNPADVLCLMNRELSGNLPVESFVTMFCGFIDLGENTLTYANAGHPRPSYREKGAVLELEGNDSFLGPIEAANFRNFSISIKDGLELFLYTDGIMDVFDETQSEQIGKELLGGILEDMKDPMDAFTAIRDRWSSDELILTDDCTFMLVRIDKERE